MECSRVSTQHPIMQVPAWDWRSVSGSSMGQEAESGLNLSPEEVRRFSLPCRVQPDAEQMSSGAVPHVFLAEDNAADIGLVREALDEHGVRCELTVLRNGAAAIQFIEEVEQGLHTCPDLIIVDLNLPRKSGREVLQRVRESKVCKDVAVLILTSSDSQKDKDAVAEYKPSMYIRKPSRLQEFLTLGNVFKSFLYPVT